MLFSSAAPFLLMFFPAPSFQTKRKPLTSFRIFFSNVCPRYSVCCACCCCFPGWINIDANGAAVESSCGILYRSVHTPMYTNFMIPPVVFARCTLFPSLDTGGRHQRKSWCLWWWYSPWRMVTDDLAASIPSHIVVICIRRRSSAWWFNTFFQACTDERNCEVTLYHFHEKNGRRMIKPSLTRFQMTTTVLLFVIQK